MYQCAKRIADLGRQARLVYLFGSLFFAPSLPFVTSVPFVPSVPSMKSYGCLSTLHFKLDIQLMKGKIKFLGPSILIFTLTNCAI